MVLMNQEFRKKKKTRSLFAYTKRRLMFVFDLSERITWPYRYFPSKALARLRF